MNEQLAHLVIEYTATGLGAVGVGFIVFGTLLGLVKFIESAAHEKPAIRQVRITLGQYTLFGMGFLVGQDIVETVIDPSFEQLLGLAGIVAIRTVLEYFVGKELEHNEHEHHDHDHDHHEGHHETAEKHETSDDTAARGWWPAVDRSRYLVKRANPEGAGLASNAGSALRQRSSRATSLAELLRSKAQLRQPTKAQGARV